MSSVANNRVYKSFIAQANAAYREAGLSEYQMRIKADGSITIPNHPKLARARAGAQSARAGTAHVPVGPPPALTKVTSPAADTVQLSWEPVPGAVRYGIWQDGKLIGTVPNPQFTAAIAAGATSAISIDAEFAAGERSPKTQTVSVKRSGDAAVQVSVANGAAAAQGAPVPAAATDATAGAAAATAPAAATR